MEDTIGTPINFANKVVTERRVPSQVHAFLYNREKVINRLFAGAAEKQRRAVRPGKQKIFY